MCRPGPNALARAAHAGINPDLLGPGVAQMIAVYREAHGRSPLWGEVAEVFRWSRAHTSLVLRALAAEGWIGYSPQPRSLEPGPRLAAPAPRREPTCGEAHPARAAHG